MAATVQAQTAPPGARADRGASAVERGAAPGVAPPMVSTGHRALDLLLSARVPAGAGSAAASVPAAATATASAPMAPATPAATVEAAQPTLRESLQREAAEFAAAQKQAEAHPEGAPLPPAAVRDPEAERARAAEDDALRAAVDRFGLRSTLWWLRENRDWLFSLVVLGVVLGLAVPSWKRSRAVLAEHRRRRRQARRRAERAQAEAAAAPCAGGDDRSRRARRQSEPAAPAPGAPARGPAGEGSRRRRTQRSATALRPHRAAR